MNKKAKSLGILTLTAILSFIVATMVMLTSVVASEPVVTTAEYVNLLTNPDFEDGVHGVGWYGYNHNTEGLTEDVTFVSDETDVKSGTKSALAKFGKEGTDSTTAGGRSLFQTVKILPDSGEYHPNYAAMTATYEFSFWAKIDIKTLEQGGITLRVQIDYIWDDGKTALESKSISLATYETSVGEWTKFTYTFSPKENFPTNGDLTFGKNYGFKQFGIYFENNSQTVADFRLDGCMLRTIDTAQNLKSDLIGKDAHLIVNELAFKDNYAGATAMTVEYDESVGYYSDNGSIKLSRTSVVAGAFDETVVMAAPIAFSEIANEPYLLTLKLRYSNLQSPVENWPQGFNYYGLAGTPGENNSLSFSETSNCFGVTYFNVNRYIGGIYKGSSDGFITISFWINPHAAAVRTDYTHYIPAFRLCNTSGTYWIDDWSIVRQGTEVPVYTDGKPDVSVGAFESDVATGSYVALPMAYAVDEKDGDISANISVSVTYYESASSNGESVQVSENKFVADKPGDYQIVYSVQNSAGKSSEQTVTIRASGDLPVVTVSNAEYYTSNTFYANNQLILQRASATYSGNEISVKVKVVKGSEEVFVQSDDEFVSEFSERFTPTVPGEYTVIYYAETENSNGNKLTGYNSIILTVEQNPVALGIGNYEGNYIANGHAENYTGWADLYDDGWRRWPDDTSKVDVVISEEQAYSGKNSVKVTYNQKSETAFFNNIDLTSKPIMKDVEGSEYAAVEYSLHVYMFVSNDIIVSEGESAQFKISIIMKPSCELGDGVFVYSLPITLDADDLGKWVEYTLKFTPVTNESLKDNSLYTPSENEEFGDTASNFDYYTCMSVDFATLNFTGDVYFDDISLLKSSENHPDYKTEYADSEPPKQGDEEPIEDKKSGGCKSNLSVGGSVYFTLTILVSSCIITLCKKQKNK